MENEKVPKPLPPKRPLPTKKAQTIVRLEIGPNLRKAIETLLEKVGEDNYIRVFKKTSPGDEVRKAFGIDLTMVGLKAAGSSRIIRYDSGGCFAGNSIESFDDED